MPIHIIQHGTDGFGHQLLGLFSCLLLHGVGDYRFEGYTFLGKPFRFDHIDQAQSANCKEYMLETVSNFIKDISAERVPISKGVHAHELHRIENPTKDTIYSLDNAYYFDRVQMTDLERMTHRANIERMKHYFMNAKLPPNILPAKHIVMHIRLGDAMTSGRGDSIRKYNTHILGLIERFKGVYPGYHYIIHSDGDVSEITRDIDSFTVRSKSTPIMDVLCDFIHSRIFVCGNSGLSKVCSFLGDKELVIVNDDNRHSMPTGTFTISGYLSQ